MCSSDLFPSHDRRELADILESFEPYGEGNERPIFTAKNKLVKEIKPIGKEKGFRLTLCDESSHEQKTVKAVCFRGNAKPKEGEYVNFRFSVYKNVSRNYFIV